MTSRRRYRCRFCNHVLPAWLPVAKRPDGAMLLYHLSVGPSLERMSIECLATVAAEAFEVVE